MFVSPFQKARSAYTPKLPEIFSNGAAVKAVLDIVNQDELGKEAILPFFPMTYGAPSISFEAGGANVEKSISVGVILSGGQAPGGHNVIAGLFDGLKSLHPDNKLYGFLGGPSGFVENNVIEITAEYLAPYRNTGGFDIIGSGRTKLEEEEQFMRAAENCRQLNISSVVVIGGDDSNTNACLLAEYYKANDIPIQVVGCPKTIDGDLKNKDIEVSFGFDTACRVYSELIGNIMRDCSSSKKYWHFIRLMGRSASHITLECALQTHPNIALIGEEIKEKNMSLSDVVEEMAKIIAYRAMAGENFGVALVPEGIIEFIPEVGALIAELNELLHQKESEFSCLSNNADKVSFVVENLSSQSSSIYVSLPELIQVQLTSDRDPHGNVQVSLIETEKLLLEMVQVKLERMKEDGEFVGKFGHQTHFFGYEGRCAAPTNFDADYCYSLGYTAAALINEGVTGYMACVKNLIAAPCNWAAGGTPISSMMNIERRHGHDKPVIKKALVDLDDGPFILFSTKRDLWARVTSYIYPGAIQYFGPSTVCDLHPITLDLES